MTKPPAKRPCGSCPYRRDAPSGLWHESEYAKLPRYDRPTHEQPENVFACHQQDGRICAGWAGTHDMEQNLGLRIYLAMGFITMEEMLETMEYESPIPLFGSGQEAADHGMRDLLNPSEKTSRVQRKLLKKKGVVRG